MEWTTTNILPMAMALASSLAWTAEDPPYFIRQDDRLFPSWANRVSFWYLRAVFIPSDCQFLVKLVNGFCVYLYIYPLLLVTGYILYGFSIVQGITAVSQNRKWYDMIDYFFFLHEQCFRSGRESFLVDRSEPEPGRDTNVFPLIFMTCDETQDLACY